MKMADVTIDGMDSGTVHEAAGGARFAQDGLIRMLETFGKEELDTLNFGVIGFDTQTVVRRYNRFESTCAGLAPEHVIGQRMFTSVAPCMNNFMVAQRFEDAVADGSELDAVIDYVLTLRMRPVKVRLRLLAHPGVEMRYVLVDRPG